MTLVVSASFCRYIKGMSQEDREKRADGMFSEFLSSSDVKEVS